MSAALFSIRSRLCRGKVVCKRGEGSLAFYQADQVGAPRKCSLMGRHAQCADECPLLGAKRTLTNRCLPISIYEYTA